MGILEMADGRIYTDTKDGRLVPLYPEKVSFGIDKNRVFAYDRKSGVLKINKDMFLEGFLEQITKQISQHPEGILLSLTDSLIGHTVDLKGVKAVRYLCLEEQVSK